MRSSRSAKLCGMTNQQTKILVGNSFPFSLIRRRVTVEPVRVEWVRAAMAGAEIHSFWGHAATRAAAESVLGISLATAKERPELLLSSDNLPMLDGHAFDACYVCSPNYVSGFRPKIGEEVSADQIVGWQTLLISWK